MRSIIRTAIALWMAASASYATAQELIVYANDGQSAEQQAGDEFACYKWGKDQTGFDPMVLPTATAPPPKQEAAKGGVGRGLLRGAAIGGIVGGSSGAKKGAGAGAVIGGVRRNDQKKKQAQKEQQWADEQARQYATARNTYNRAYAACMGGRGYTVL